MTFISKLISFNQWNKLIQWKYWFNLEYKVYLRIPLWIVWVLLLEKSGGFKKKLHSVGMYFTSVYIRIFDGERWMVHSNIVGVGWNIPHYPGCGLRKSTRVDLVARHASYHKFPSKEKKQTPCKLEVQFRAWNFIHS